MNQNVRRANAKQKCSVCKQWKNRGSRMWYRNSTCPACYMAAYRNTHPEKVRSAKLKCYYGVSVEHFNKMLKKQRGKCAVCKNEHNKTKSGKHQNFVIDHCHSSGAIRGLLCHTCNMRVGVVENWSKRVTAYLNKH